MPALEACTLVALTDVLPVVAARTPVLPCWTTKKLATIGAMRARLLTPIRSDLKLRASKGQVKKREIG